ncbi:MAG TPA: hypothetical protein VF129_00135 [Actinomycetota bacterium]
MATTARSRYRNRALRRHLGDQRTLGQRAADTIAARLGSWAEAENRVIAQLPGLSGEEFVARVENQLGEELMSDRPHAP